MKKESVFSPIQSRGTTTSDFISGTTMPRLEDLVGYKLVDPSGDEIGTVHCAWEDTRRQSAFLGVKTGWLGLGAIHAVPSFSAEFSVETNTVRVPFTKSIVKGAPSFDEEEELSEASEKEIYDYYSSYGMDLTKTTPLSSQRPSSGGARPEREGNLPDPPV